MKHFFSALSVVAATISVTMLSSTVAAEQTEQSGAELFEQCLVDFQQQARRSGLSAATIDTVIPALEYQAKVIEYDRRQPEFTQTFADYFNTRVNQRRIDRARELYREKRPLLDKLAAEYGVPGQYLIAFWGLETNFGNYLGKMPTLDSLATLGCDPRRSEFFSRELITALKLLEREKLTPAQMHGSWAGAMGHTQFMPSAYSSYAVDGDGDGRIDLWRSQDDALTSAANFLQQLGWQRAERWGREVKLTADFDYINAGRSTRKSIDDWRSLGVRRADGSALPQAQLEASVLVPMGASGPAFLVYPNFRVIMRWNFSESYAIAVGQLADRTAGGGGLLQSLDTPTPKLNPVLIKQLQRALNDCGFDAGKADGVIGSGTRAALRAYQASKGLIADGYPGFSSFKALGIAIAS